MYGVDRFPMLELEIPWRGGKRDLVAINQSARAPSTNEWSPSKLSADDAELVMVVTQARDGVSGAWETLVGRFGGLVVAIARRCRLSDADVAEVCQTTWLRLVENLDRIEQPERLGA